MRHKKLDYFLLFLVVVLVVLGSSFLANLSAPVSLEKFETPNYFLIHQILRGLIPGIILGIIFFKISLSFLKKIAPILFLLNVIILTFVFLPKIGVQLGGANRWIDLRWIIFQPSEFLKITSVLYLATWLQGQNKGDSDISKKKYFSKKTKNTYNLTKTFIPFLVILGVISIILVLQPDVSTLGIIILISLIVYFAAGTPIWHGILMIVGGMGGLLTLIRLEQYRFSRFLVFLEPETDPLGIGFQMKQALIAIGSGGIFGRGWGMSSQKFGFLPQAMSDSTFAIFAEETGLIGSVLLVLVFVMFLWRGLRISKLANDKFSQLVALGITFWIVTQTFINISSITGILPLTGTPLPFISYGGSHLVAELIGIGILLNISKNCKT